MKEPLRVVGSFISLPGYRFEGYLFYNNLLSLTFVCFSVSVFIKKFLKLPTHDTKLKMNKRVYTEKYVSFPFLMPDTLAPLFSGNH